MEGRKHYAVDTLFRFATIFAERGLGFLKRCGLTRMTVLYIGMENKTVFVQIGGGWVESELVGLQSKIWKFKSVSGKTSAPQCLSALLSLKFHVLEHHVDDFERFGGFLSINERPFELFQVLTKKFY